jgi:hypothetical protein
MLNRLRQEAEDLERSLIEIPVYSQGSISWSDAIMMSTAERRVAVKVINNYNQIKSGKPPNEEL